MLLAMLSAGLPCRAATEPPATQSAPAVTVAILDFTTDVPGEPNLGPQISDVLVASLSGQPGYTLVDRSSLTRVLQEHELNLTGIVDKDQGVKIGKLIGAKILVTGRVSVLDKQIFIFAKLIGTETSEMQGYAVKGDIAAGTGPLIIQLAEKMVTQLPIDAPKLIAREDMTLDPIPALKKTLAGMKLPKIGIRVSEKHLSDAQAGHFDPAVDTEWKMMLTDAGFTVIEGDDADLAKAGVGVILNGEAFSELAAHIGNLVSCTDRVELHMTQFADGKVLLADRDNNRAVDLSENLAGKLAIQKSAHLLGIHILQYFANNTPAK
jgi:hypothetical protein